MRIFRRQTFVAVLWLFSLGCLEPSILFAQQPSEPADRKKYEQASALFREAYAVAEDAPGEQRRAAIKKFMSAAEIFHSIASKSEEANSLNAAANVHDGLSEKAEAVHLYLQVADILHEINDSQHLVITLSRIGTIYYEAGFSAKALEYFNVALVGRQTMKDAEGEALTLNYIGNSYHALGEYKKAIEALEQSLAIKKRIGDESGQIASLGNLSVVYMSMGENEKALGYLDQSLKLARSLGDKVGEATSLHNIGALYDALGDTDRALDHYNRALQIKGGLNNGRMEGVTLNNIGAIYLSNGDTKRAREYLYKALPMRFAANDLPGAIETLVNIGSLHSDLGEKDQALGFYNRALPMIRRQGNRSAEAETLHNIGYAYEQEADHVNAIRFYNDALPLRRAVGDTPGEARTLAALMDAWRALGNDRLAVLYGKQAINRFQVLRSVIHGLDTSVRKKYLSSIEGTYRFLANLLIEQGRISEAEEVLGMLKEEEVFAYQRRDDQVAKELLQKSTLTESERTAIAGYEKLAEQITAIAREYGDLDNERLAYPEGKFPKQARLDELDKQRANATIAFQKYLEQLKVEFAKSSKDKEVSKIDSSLQSTLREMKADRTAVVSTVAGEKRLNIIVTTAEIQRAHTVATTEVNLNKLIAAFRVALTSPASGKPVDPRPAAQKLYDILVKPIEGDLAGIKADTIVWSLDGSLRYLPMAALWDKDKGYLAERFANAVVTLASRERLLLPPLKRNWTALGAGVSSPTDGFSALAAVPDELDCIVTDSQLSPVSLKPVCATGVIPGRKLLDEKFDEPAFRAAMGRYSILHIASHFKLVPGNENDSFLLLGGGADRHFTLNKLKTISLTGVELLALSACNTATPGGAKANGIEIEGFGAVAQERGARSVMATLWPVADPSTRDLMVEFYRRFGTGAETKAESLRQAQLRLMRGARSDADGVKPPRADALTVSGQAADGPPFEIDKNAPYAHPYYWAPFILFGNWR
jgi:CHAT domain-containing protein/tetratricopeptide (TPR) repeat protein